MKSDQREEMRSWEKWNIKTEKQIKHRLKTLEIVINNRGQLCLSSHVSLTQTLGLDNVSEAALSHTPEKPIHK